MGGAGGGGGGVWQEGAALPADHKHNRFSQERSDGDHILNLRRVEQPSVGV